MVAEACHEVVLSLGGDSYQQISSRIQDTLSRMLLEEVELSSCGVKVADFVLHHLATTEWLAEEGRTADGAGDRCTGNDGI